MIDMQFDPLVFPSLGSRPNECAVVKPKDQSLGIWKWFQQLKFKMLVLTGAPHPTLSTSIVGPTGTLVPKYRDRKILPSAC